MGVKCNCSCRPIYEQWEHDMIAMDQTSYWWRPAFFKSGFAVLKMVSKLMETTYKFWIWIWIQAKSIWIGFYDWLSIHIKQRINSKGLQVAWMRIIKFHWVKFAAVRYILSWKVMYNVWTNYFAGGINL